MSMGFLCGFNGISLGFLWDFFVFPWDFYRISLAFL